MNKRKLDATDARIFLTMQNHVHVRDLPVLNAEEDRLVCRHAHVVMRRLAAIDELVEGARRRHGLADREYLDMKPQ